LCTIQQTQQAQQVHQLARKRALFNPTIQEIESDSFTQIANENWRNLPHGEKAVFSKELVEAIFVELQKSHFAFPRIMLLEFSQYLEKFVVLILCHLKKRRRETNNTNLSLLDIFGPSLILKLPRFLIFCPLSS
jgi:hypothetical protein